ncbi:uncharacterized protein LOC133285257 isoform X2 [Gastrolobium bilobum]|uniref:uncharacterized protein LOC133285257 isoform X2 n=1 Tax=Gastrolobium bilobum TaxID=150636 RepID=UPI002AB1162D|nr:uncharacterized protein LOC133285257 isoform X2 [Gastrolobium bilobum]
MGHTIPREKDVEFDLESGGSTSEEDASNERESKSAFNWAWNGILNFDGSDKGKSKSGIESCSYSAKSGDVGAVDENNLELLVDKGLEHVPEQLSHVNGNHTKQKTKPTNPRKPPKPPLPPKGPSLDAGDQKFVKELAELALRKRARIKKMKAVRKMKANKSSSSSSSSSTFTSLSAMVITIFFFFVIIFHGIRSASSAAVGSMASPEAAVAADEGLISVQYPINFDTSEGNASGSHYATQQER